MNILLADLSRKMSNKIKSKKKYTVLMSSMYGTYTAGTYITETSRQAKAKAKKQNGPEWTYYISK